MISFDNMDIPVSDFPQVTVKPDSSEKRDIRRRYTKIGLVIILNVFLFNFVLLWAVRLGCALYVMDFSESGMNDGLRLLYSNPVAATLVSMMIPIISEILSIIIGIRIFKIDIKGMFNRQNYTTGTIVKLVTLCLGLQTFAAFAATIIQTVLDSFNVKVDLPDLSVNLDSALSNVLLYSYACLLGPVLEELLYRGFLLQALRKYNERMAIFVTALIFGLMHQNYQQFILGFLIGIPLAIVTIKCGSLIPAVITHIVVNTSGVLVTLLMAYNAPADYESIVSGNYNIMDISSDMFGILIFNAIFRYGFMFAALIVGIIVLVKGKNMSKPTPAGKSRGVPILASSWTWVLIFAFYVYINFLQPIF